MILFWLILAYFLIRFIFNFVIPVARTARQMKKQMNDFQEKMNNQGQGARGGEYSEAREKKSSPHSRAGDYIDFEEIK